MKIVFNGEMVEFFVNYWFLNLLFLQIFRICG